MTLDELWQHHQNHLKLKKRSVNTLTFYQHTLYTLKRYQSTQQDIFPDRAEEVTVTHLRNFLGWLEEQQLVVGSIHAHGRAVRAVFLWAVEEELLSRNPVRRLELPSLSKDRLPALQPKQLQLLLDAAQKSPLPLRNRALLLMMFDTGIRLGELAALKETDVMMEQGMMKVMGKGAKERRVPVGSKVLLALNRYSQRERRPAHPGVKHLFLGRQGVPLDRSGISQLLNRLGQQAGLSRQECTPHTFRRGFAIQFLRNGGNLFALQQILGHTDLEMTRRYVQYLDEDLKDVHVRNSPVDLL